MTQALADAGKNFAAPADPGATHNQFENLLADELNTAASSD